MVDVGRQLKFPAHVAVILSFCQRLLKNFVLLELTVPWEDSREKAVEEERKNSKYQGLVEELKSTLPSSRSRLPSLYTKPTPGWAQAGR